MPEIIPRPFSHKCVFVKKGQLLYTNIYPRHLCDGYIVFTFPFVRSYEGCPKSSITLTVLPK